LVRSNYEAEWSNRRLFQWKTRDQPNLAPVFTPGADGLTWPQVFAFIQQTCYGSTGLQNDGTAQNSMDFAPQRGKQSGPIRHSTIRHRITANHPAKKDPGFFPVARPNSLENRIYGWNYQPAGLSFRRRPCQIALLAATMNLPVGKRSDTLTIRLGRNHRRQLASTWCLIDRPLLM
jgi:hypothetical protein